MLCSDLQNDKDFILEVLHQDSAALQHAGDDLKNDRDIVFAAVKQRGGA